MSIMDDYGGYEAKFIDTVLERYKCSVCTKVLRDPELAVCCGQHFCGTCLLQWFKTQRSKSCPHCRAEGTKFQHVENKSLKSEISQLRVTCSNISLGCEWTGELSNLQDHLKSEGSSGCNFADVPCTNKCGAKVPRSKLEDHMNTECKYRQETCQYCSKQDTFAAINEHKKNCPKFPLLCPNSCDSDAIPREMIGEHLKKCPLHKQTCPFEGAGCTEKMKPQEIDDHVQTNLLQHVKMLADAHTEMKTKHEKELKNIREQQDRERENVRKMKQTLVFEIKALEEGWSSEVHNTAYKCIQTQLDEEIDILKKQDPTVFRMLNFSELVKDNETWYSPPFMIQHYKLCLAVIPKGIGSGFQSHASLSLVLLEVGTEPPTTDGPTFSSLLTSIHVLVPLLKFGVPGQHHRVFLNEVCGSNLDLSPLREDEERRTLGTQEEWLNYGILKNELWKDSLVIRIEKVDTRRQSGLAPGDCRPS